MQERTERELRLNEDGGKISLNAKLPSNKNKKKCAQQVDKSTPLLIPRHGQPFDATDTGCYDHYAGWSSLVARWAHNLTLPRIPWSFLGIFILLGAFAIGRPAQQCTGRSLVKVGGTYVARAIGQYRTKPPEWWGKA